MSMQMAKRVSLSRPEGLNRSPTNRTIVPLHWVQRGVTGRSGPIDRTLALSVRSCDTCHVSPASNIVRQISMVILLTGHYAQTDRTLSHQRLVVSSKVPNMNFHDRTCPVMPDRTHPTSGPSTSPLSTSRQRTSALTGRTLPASGCRATQRLVV